MRVIAGTLGGRRFEAPRGRDTRPTSDRVREALFMALGPLQDLAVVDLYAGSGALGIEALSRGAARVDFVDSSAVARRVLEANLSRLELAARARVWAHVLPEGVRRLRGAIAGADLILLDPPYGGDAARGTLAALAEVGPKPGARVVVEHHAKDLLPPAAGGIERVRERRYGETAVSIYQVIENSGPGAEEER